MLQNGDHAQQAPSSPATATSGQCMARVIPVARIPLGAGLPDIRVITMAPIRPRACFPDIRVRRGHPHGPDSTSGSSPWPEIDLLLVGLS